MRHLLLQPHVLHELLRQLLELRALLGRHGVEHRLRGRHALRDVLEQLFDRLRILGEEVAVLLHEVLEPGIFTALMLVDHLVERRQHLFHALHVFGRHVLHGRRHLVDHLLGQLLAQLLHQLLEPLLRLTRLEVVGLQLAHLAGQIVGQHVEAELAVHGLVLRVLLAPRVATLLRVENRLVDRVAFFVDDVVQLVGDLLVHAAEVAALEQLLAPLAQALAHLLQPHHALAVGVGGPAVHEAPQSTTHVAVGQEVVGHLVEQAGRVEIEASLSSVPA